MTSTNSEIVLQKAPKNGVQKKYSEQKLANVLLDLYSKKHSLREVAAEFGVSHAVIQRGLKGRFPKRKKLRDKLNLPALAPAPVCPTCGVVHTKRCPAGRAWRDLWAMPEDVLRWKLENREDV